MSGLEALGIAALVTGAAMLGFYAWAVLLTRDWEGK